MRLWDLVTHLDTLLGHTGAMDYSGAYNGLQLENAGEVRTVAVAVDAHLHTLQAAVEGGADLLIVHHGLFWNAPLPLTGATYRKIKLCMDHGLAVYASHLPLDAHPALGNTFLLGKALGLSEGECFFEEKGHVLARRFQLDMERQELGQRLQGVTGQMQLLPWGPARVRDLAIITGGAGSEVSRMAALGVDTFLTGEGPHWTDGLARDLGMNVLYGGHYATETFGVKALGEHLEKTFQLPWRFVDAPSGL